MTRVKTLRAIWTGTGLVPAGTEMEYIASDLSERIALGQVEVVGEELPDVSEAPKGRRKKAVKNGDEA